MNRQTLIFALLFIVALSCWQYSLREDQNHQVDRGEEHFQPDFIAYNSVTNSYDVEGRLREQFESSYGEYYRLLEMGIFEQPILHLYNEMGALEWRVRARQGVWNSGDNVILRETVHGEGLLPESRLKTFDSDYLELDLVTQDVRSNQRITLVGDTFSTTGVGLRGNLELEQFELLEQSHAIYFNPPRP